MTQVILWLLFIPAWLLIIPLNLRKVKRYLSATFFTLFLTSLYWQIAEAYDWWRIIENLPFLSNISAFNYGFSAVTTIYLFYFTYRHPWLFFGANIALDAVQAFVVSPFIFEKLGFYEMTRMSNFGLFLVLISMVPLIYIYQRLYERIGNEDDPGK